MLISAVEYSQNKNHVVAVKNIRTAVEEINSNNKKYKNLARVKPSFFMLLKIMLKLTNGDKCDKINGISESMLSISQFGRLIGDNYYSEKRKYVSMKSLAREITYELKRIL